MIGICHIYCQIDLIGEYRKLKISITIITVCSHYYRERGEQEKTEVLAWRVHGRRYCVDASQERTYLLGWGNFSCPHVQG